MNSKNYIENVLSNWSEFCKSHKQFEKALQNLIIENNDLKLKNQELKAENEKLKDSKIITCKECIYFRKPNQEFNYMHCANFYFVDSSGWAMEIHPDFYCARSERK